MRRNLLYRTFHLIELVETRSAEPPSLQAICPDREPASLNRTPCCREPPLRGRQGVAPCTGLSAPKAQSPSLWGRQGQQSSPPISATGRAGVLISTTVGSTCRRRGQNWALWREMPTERILIQRKCLSHLLPGLFWKIR